jgi:2-hydroxychromene-2-carboxylate isomerase
MKRVDFFFDLSSPYSYLASTQLDGLAARTGAGIHHRPMVLGAVFKAASNVMPASSPPKAKWMFADLTRWAQEYGVPFLMSSHFPFNAIKAMRLILVGETEGKGPQTMHAAFRAAWAENRDITQETELRRIATDAGLDADRALQQIENPEIKGRLKANTDEAVQRGAFGAPAIFVGDQLFWGNDRLHQVERALRG